MRGSHCVLLLCADRSSVRRRAIAAAPSARGRCRCRRGRAQRADVRCADTPSHRASRLQPRQRPSVKNNGTCEPAHILFVPSVLALSRRFGATEMTSFREDVSSESFEAGRDLWHARIRRANREPLIVNGGAFPHSVACPHLKVGFAGTARSGKRGPASILSNHEPCTATHPEFNTPASLNGAKGNRLTCLRSNLWFPGSLPRRSAPNARNAEVASRCCASSVAARLPNTGRCAARAAAPFIWT